MAKKIVASEVSEVSTDNSNIQLGDNNTMSNEQTTNEVDANMFAIMTEVDAKYVEAQANKLRKTVQSEFDAIADLLKLLTFDAPTLDAMRLQLLASKGLTGEIEKDVQTKFDATLVKFAGKEYKLSEALPVSQLVLVDPMTKFADAFKADFLTSEAVSEFNKAVDAIKAKWLEFVTPSNLPIELTFTLKNGLGHTYIARRKGNSGKTINSGVTSVKGTDYEPNQTFTGLVSGWDVTVTTDDKRYELTMVKDGNEVYNYGGSLLKSERNKDNKGFVSAVLEHVRKNGAPNTNVGWQQMFPEQKIYVNLPESEVKRTNK